MKISILSAFYPYRGGIAQFSAATYRALEKEHDVTAYTFKRQYPNLFFPGKTQFVTDADNADTIPSVRLLDSINPINWMKVASILKKEKPDLLFFNFWMPYFAPSMGYIAGQLAPKTKVISLLHNVAPHERGFLDKPFLKYFLNRNHGFIVMSDQVKSDLLKLKPDAKYEFKPHPLYDHFGEVVDKTEACNKLGIDPNKKTLLYFGIIRKYKGLDLLIEAFGKLDNSYQLLIVGESYGSFDSYKNQIASNPNKDRIFEHVRYVSDEEVPIFFSAADTCILPYRSATQSGIIAIAYHFNLPLIVTDVGGLKEMVNENETGVVIPTPTTEAIKDGIIQYFDSNIDKFIDSIQLKKAALSWDSFAETVVDLYKDI